MPVAPRPVATAARHASQATRAHGRKTSAGSGERARNLMTGISRAFSEVKTESPHTHPAWPDQFLAHQISVKHPGIPLEIEDRPADTEEWESV